MDMDEFLKGARQRGKDAAKKMKERGGIPSDWTETLLTEYVPSRDRMHGLAKQGNQTAAQQEAYLNGFLSQWD
jgi:hypothetical protein